jgi:hypothetical protein
MSIEKKESKVVKSVKRSRNKNGIRRNILLMAVSGIMITSLLFAVADYFAAKEIVEQVFTSKMELAQDLTTRLVDSWIEERRNEAINLSNSREIISYILNGAPAEDLGPLLDNFRKSIDLSGWYESIVVYETNGLALITPSTQMIGVLNVTDR